MRRPTASSRSGRRIPRAALVTAVAGVGLGGAYLVALGLAGGDIPSGTTVRGVDIGGLSTSDAAAKLDAQLGKRAGETVKVRIAGQDADVDPRTAGLSLDSRATAERAAHPGHNPVAVFSKLFSGDGGEVDPAVTVDQDKARTALAAAAKQHDRAPRNGAIAFENGTPRATAPQDGVRLDVDRSVDTLGKAFLGDADAQAPELPVNTTAPAVGKEQTDRALKNVARPAMSGPVTLTADGKRITVEPALLGRHLTLQPGKDGELAPRLDAKGLRADPAMARKLATVTNKVTEAQIGIQDSRAVVTKDGTAGHTLATDDLGKAVLPLLTKSGEQQRTGPVKVTTQQPKITRTNVDDLGIKEKISEFTVDFPSAPYRVTNIGRAAELINGSVVLPGNEWSFNKTVGERTKENGFVDGIMINNGVYEKAAGGGVSAVATTMFNAMYFAGVKPVEYGAHSFYIERYPEGREATVAWGSLDLRFNNDTGNAIYIRTKATDTSITVTFLGTKKYDEIKSEKGPRENIVQPKKREGAPGDKCEAQTPLEGFDVTVQRVFVQDGKEVKREPFRTHYTPRDEVTCS
ncbi:VanW family protein [Streptomyces sp. NPDC050085]|uniref:VanW family protein n=1 Tax=Streptomyces sp. NPDC050085 TaxID=3365600 RepID=UPI0037B54859